MAGKYSQYERYRPKKKPRPWDVHPIWRGIGCLLSIIIPIFSYAVSVLFFEENARSGWIAIPYDLAVPPQVPLLSTINFFYAKLILAVVLMIALYGLLIVLYSFIFQATRPPKYGPQDAPPIRRRDPRKRDR